MIQRCVNCGEPCQFVRQEPKRFVLSSIDQFVENREQEKLVARAKKAPTPKPRMVNAAVQLTSRSVLTDNKLSVVPTATNKPKRTSQWLRVEDIHVEIPLCVPCCRVDTV